MLNFFFLSLFLLCINCLQQWKFEFAHCDWYKPKKGRFSALYNEPLQSREKKERIEREQHCFKYKRKKRKKKWTTAELLPIKTFIQERYVRGLVNFHFTFFALLSILVQWFHSFVSIISRCKSSSVCNFRYCKCMLYLLSLLHFPFR